MLPIYEIIDGDLTAVSLVQHPAIESDFMLFKKQEKMKFSFNEEKHIAFGPALIVDKPIYRIDSEGREFYVVFTKEVIEQLFTDFMKNKISKFNLEHAKDTNGVFLLESFLKRDGIQPIGYEDTPNGSWFISLKVEDEQIWQDLKSGKYNGFSVECNVSLGETDDIDNLIDELTNDK